VRWPCFAAFSQLIWIKDRIGESGNGGGRERHRPPGHLEAIIGELYPATLLARLVTLNSNGDGADQGMPMMKLAWCAALLALLPGAALAGTINPSGADDTAALQQACNRGGIVVLSAGDYHVRTITCANIVSASTEAFFYYEGQQPTVRIRGIPAGARGVVVCPPPGPCAYRGFDISPPAGEAGIVLDSIHGAQLFDVSVVDDTGGQSGACVDMNVTQGDNQNIVVRGGTYLHCGGWCFDFSTKSDKGTSDSSWYGADIANCGLGGVHIAFGYGNQFIGNRIQDQYAQPGVQLDSGGTIVLDGNLFDQNFSDVVLGNVYLVAAGNLSCRTQGGAMFDLEGEVAINASGNLSCGPTYLVGTNGTLTGGAFYDPLPSYADPHTQQVLSGSIR